MFNLNQYRGFLQISVRPILGTKTKNSSENLHRTDQESHKGAVHCPLQGIAQAALMAKTSTAQRFPKYKRLNCKCIKMIVNRIDPQGIS